MFATPTSGRATEILLARRAQIELRSDLEALGILDGIMLGLEYKNRPWVPGLTWEGKKHLWGARNLLAQRVAVAVAADPALLVYVINLAVEGV